jgi:hypothetical protein
MTDEWCWQYSPNRFISQQSFCRFQCDLTKISNRFVHWKFNIANCQPTHWWVVSSSEFPLYTWKLYTSAGNLSYVWQSKTNFVNFHPNLNQFIIEQCLLIPQIFVLILEYWFDIFFKNYRLSCWQIILTQTDKHKWKANILFTLTAFLERSRRWPAFFPYLVFIKYLHASG